jgi:chromosome segregation ATPase
VTQLEDKCGRLDKDKATLNELLASRRREYEYLEDEMKMKICDLEDQIRRLANDKNRLMDRMNLPESERGLLQQQEKDIADLYQKLEEVSIRYADAEDENIVLKQEIKDLQLGIDEMHDQFREVRVNTHGFLKMNLLL